MTVNHPKRTFDAAAAVARSRAAAATAPGRKSAFAEPTPAERARLANEHDEQCENLPGGDYAGKTIGGRPIPCHCVAREHGRKLAQREIAAAQRKVARDRAETDYCQRGTQGCCIDHAGDDDCDTW